jgi:RNA polymerase-binding transcription factor DksA
VHYRYLTIEQRERISRVIQTLMQDERPEGAGSALARLRSPDYGVCEVCEGDVPFVRLLDDPLARRCRRCESS